MTIKIKPENKGKLHSALHIKQGEGIPLAKENAALKGAKKGSALKKELNFAVNARAWGGKK